MVQCTKLKNTEHINIVKNTELVFIYFSVLNKNVCAVFIMNYSLKKKFIEQLTMHSGIVSAVNDTCAKPKRHLNPIKLFDQPFQATHYVLEKNNNLYIMQF